MLTAIEFVSHSSALWNMLAQELRCGPGAACCQRLAQWQRIQKAVLTEVAQRGQPVT